MKRVKDWFERFMEWLAPTVPNDWYDNHGN
jgi:hypothetical protein